MHILIHKSSLKIQLFVLFSKEMLIQRLGSNAHAFSMEITHLAPPSVQLVPAKEYNGAPIGTSYDIRVYIGMDKKLYNINNIINYYYFVYIELYVYSKFIISRSLTCI